MANSIKFQARLILLDNEIRQIDIWLNRLYIAVSNHARGSALEESVREELGRLDADDIRKAFELQADKDYEILCSGEVSYYQSTTPDSYGEWDSSLDFDEQFESGEIDADTAKYLLEEFNAR